MVVCYRWCGGTFEGKMMKRARREDGGGNGVGEAMVVEGGRKKAEMGEVVD